MAGRRYRMSGRRRLARVGHFLGGQWMLLEPYEYVQSHIYNRGVWEPHVSTWLSEQLRPGSVFVDVGANIGYYVLLSARLVGEEGRVVAVEPLYSRTIRRQVALNHWRNVSVCAAAAGDRTGTVEIGVAGPWNRGHSSVIQPARFGRVAKVDLVRLDDLVRTLALPRVDLMKIDVEGYEVEVLRGAAALLSAAEAPRLVFELSPDFLRGAGHSDVELKELVTSMGYALFHLEDAGTAEAPAYRLTPLDPSRPGSAQIDVVALKPHHL